MSYFKRFVQWQNYAHYALNAVLLTAYYGLFATFDKSYLAMGVELAIALLVSDSIVHGIFYILPKPYQWRD